MAKGNAEATTKIYEQVQGLDAEDRLRAANAALTMLGEPVLGETKSSRSGNKGKGETPADGFSEKAEAWIKKYQIESSALDDMFHLDNGRVELILGEAIGKSKRDQTVNTYLLTGIAALLEAGSPEFADETARGYCRHLGCYNSPNHSLFTKRFGNKLTGSKDSGWKLTAPGLAAAAHLIDPVRQDEK